MIIITINFFWGGEGTRAKVFWLQTFPPCFCGHMNKFLQEGAVKYLPLLSGLEHHYTYLARRRLLTGGKYYSIMHNVSPSEAEDMYKKTWIGRRNRVHYKENSESAEGLVFRRLSLVL